MQTNNNNNNQRNTLTVVFFLDKDLIVSKLIDLE